MITQDYTPIYAAIDIERAIALVAPRIKGIRVECMKVPEIGAYDFDRLVEAIKRDGLLRPIEIDHLGWLLDGRSRIQVCAILGIQLTEENFVVTNADPLAIARSNYARRHLTDDQKVMEALEVLKEERKKAAQRRKEGGAKGRESMRNSLGTKSVPSETKEQSRNPRAVDIAASRTGVSRDRLKLAKHISDVSPELADEVKAGTLSMNDAAAQTGVVVKKTSKPKQAKPKPEPSPPNAQPESAVGAAMIPWSDQATTVKDFRNGIRMHRCKRATLFTHKKTGQTGVVLRDGDEWWWLVVGPDEAQGTCPKRLDAETAVYKGLKSLLMARAKKGEQVAKGPSKPR